METLVGTILTQYFFSSQCLVIVTDNNNTISSKIPFPILNLNLDFGNFSEKSDLLFNNFGCQEFILLVDNAVSVFQSIEMEIKLHTERFNQRKYFFIPVDSKSENVFKIFDTEEIKYVSDILVMNKENENSYSLWTHKYVGIVDKNRPYMLDKWFLNSSSFLFGNSLLPNKLRNQEGRDLRAAVFPYEPYVVIEPQEDGTYKYMGSEMLTMLTFAECHNMTLVPVINKCDYWGEIWNNWSGNGLMGNLVEDKADIGGGALYTWEESYRFLDLSKPTVRTGITCLVPASRPAAGWLTPVYAYSIHTWLAVISAFLLSVLTIYLYEILSLMPNYKNKGILPIKKDRNLFTLFGRSFLSVAKSFVMQNVTIKEMIKGQFGKYLMGLVFMTTLILSSTYQSGLATIMTIPRFENPINTIDEFVESGLFWGATQDAWITSIEKATEEKFQKIVSRFVATSEEKLRQYSLTGEFAFSLERLPKDNYAVGSYIKEDVIQNFHLMYEDFYWEQCVLMARKSSVLLPQLDIFILRTFEAGLISVWQNDAATQYMNQYVQKVVKYLSRHQNDRGVVKLKISHLAGAFGILCAGNTLAFVIFLLEHFYYKLFVK